MRAFALLSSLVLLVLPLAAVAQAVIDPRSDLAPRASSLLVPSCNCNSGTGPGTGSPCQCPSPLYRDVDDGSCECHDDADVEISIIFEGGGFKATFGCVCKAKNAKYDAKHGKCLCKSGYSATLKDDGDLKSCHKIHPSGRAQANKRELEEVVEERKYDESSRVLEDYLSCEPNEKACQAGKVWKCTDVWSDTGACGGCPGEGADCEGLEGVSEVSCTHGSCVIGSCQRGYELIVPSLEAPSHTHAKSNATSLSAHCMPHRKSGNWLLLQDGSHAA